MPLRCVLRTKTGPTLMVSFAVGITTMVGLGTVPPINFRMLLCFVLDIEIEATNVSNQFTCFNHPMF